MTMYLLTEQEHAQIMEALDNGLPEVRTEALAMLKAMKPVKPTACKVATESGLMVWPIEDFNDAGPYCDPDEFPIYLYAKEQP